jgi:quinol monooxygenase YgiN
MYGTVARTRVKPENREALQKVFSSRTEGQMPPGYRAGYLLFENDSDVAWLLAVFDDRASYDANADDPEQHQMYVEYRALMEEEPEWHDGRIEGM